MRIITIFGWQRAELIDNIQLHDSKSNFMSFLLGFDLRDDFIKVNVPYHVLICFGDFAKIEPTIVCCVVIDDIR